MSAAVCGLALRFVSACMLRQMNSVKEIFAVADSDVDGVAGFDREGTDYACVDADSSVAVEGNVGTACVVD